MKMYDVRCLMYDGNPAAYHQPSDIKHQPSHMSNPTAVRAETRAETHQPEIAVAIRTAVLQRLLECEQHRGTAHVAAAFEDARAGVERVRRDDRRERFEDVASSGVRHHAGDGARTA